MKSVYQRYLERDFPPEFQKKIDAFESALLNADEIERLFRAAWYIGKHQDELNDYIENESNQGE